MSTCAFARGECWGEVLLTDSHSPTRPAVFVCRGHREFPHYGGRFKKPPCVDRGHGITCLDPDEGPGSYCRVCGGPVAEAEVAPRTALERIRGALVCIEYLTKLGDIKGIEAATDRLGVQVIERQLRTIAGRILGKPEDEIVKEAPKL